MGPHPAVAEAIARAATAANRYPDPSAALLRRRIAERFEVDPAEIAVANGSCEILLAAAMALCEPGAELVFAWPSFSIYPYLAPLSGAREIRVPLNDRAEHDLEAIAAEVTVGDPAGRRLQPEQPDRHPPAGAADRRALRAAAGPRHGARRRGLRRVPARRRPRRGRRPAPRVPQPGHAAHVQQGLRARRACGSATRSARRPSAPRSTRCASRSASTRSRRPPPPRRSATPTTSPSGSSATSSSGSWSRRGCARWDSRRPTRRRTSPGSRSATPTRPRSSPRSPSAGSSCAPGTPLGGPGHIRVSYGTPEQNRRFLAALEELV